MRYHKQRVYTESCIQSAFQSFLPKHIAREIGWLVGWDLNPIPSGDITCSLPIFVVNAFVRI